MVYWLYKHLPTRSEHDSLNHTYCENVLATKTPTKIYLYNTNNAPPRIEVNPNKVHKGKTKSIQKINQ